MALFLGIALTLGYGSSLLLEKLGIPNVVVYLVVGFLIGNIFLPDFIITEEFDYWYHFIQNIALGLIGFKIGTEMELHLLKDQQRTLTILVITQVFAAFILVFIAAYLWIGSFLVAMIFGGLATATAPAVTMEIIRKYNAAGPLTKNMQWVLAFDDVLAVLIVEGVLSYAAVAALGEGVTVLSYLIAMGHEIGLAIVLGGIIGFGLDMVIERMTRDVEMMEITLGVLILVIGLAMTIHMSVILSAMMVGAVTTNREGNNYKDASHKLEIIMSPILIIFFVFVGAEITFGEFSPFPWFAIIFLIARGIGKIFGTMGGAQLTDAPTPVKKYLGLGMLPQGGVALGLMSVASEILIEAGDDILGHLIITTIVVSTAFSEILGSFGTTFALTQADELDKALVPQTRLV